jgi:membrane protease YdiL (CAAX protease family)
VGKSCSASGWLAGHGVADAECSLAFSALHWPVHGITYAIAVFVPSLVLGWLFLIYRSLPMTIAVHAY